MYFVHTFVACLMVLTTVLSKEEITENKVRNVRETSFNCDVCNRVLGISDDVDDVFKYLKTFRNEVLDKLNDNINKGSPVCSTRYGPTSDTNDDDTSVVTCLEDEFLTGCSSVATEGGKRDGERVDFSDNGTPICVAYNAAGGTGVKSVARCCKWPGMLCYYPVSARSSGGDDDVAEVECDQWFHRRPTWPTGCSIHGPWNNVDGARPESSGITTEQHALSERVCLAQNAYNGPGVYSSAACCSAPSLECQVKYSEQSGPDSGDEAQVDCDEGWIMTGCNVFTYWTITNGAYIQADTCHAVNGGNGNYVLAVATCCRGE